MERAPIAAFDLDGTLTTRDTLLPFLVRVAGPASAMRSLARHAGAAASAATGRGRRGDRDALKALVLADLLGGFDRARLDTLGEAHADHIATHWLRLDVLARLSWHRQQEHAVVLVSASLGCYVRPLAERLGIDVVLCTEMEVGEGDRLTGRMVGGNCRGQAKADRVMARFGTGTPLAYAYGNSRGDRELLALAARPVWVGHRALRPLPVPVPA